MATLTGVAQTLQDIIQGQLHSPGKLLYGVALILFITYSSIIPTEYRIFADSLLGRVLSIGVLYGIIQTLGWVYGLLTLMAIVLLINGAPRLSEGFDGGGTVSEKKTVGKRWFVEKILGETPKAISTDHVTTIPPSD
jgi:hypothetical protein